MQLNTTPAFPGENGRTAGRGHANIPVVFLTAHSDAQTAREGIAAGGCAFLTKTCQLEELGQAVADAAEGNAPVRTESPFADRMKLKEEMR